MDKTLKKDLLIDPRIGMMLLRNDGFTDNSLIDALRGKIVQVYSVDFQVEVVTIKPLDSIDFDELPFTPSLIPMSFDWFNYEIWTPVIT